MGHPLYIIKRMYIKWGKDNITYFDENCTRVYLTMKYCMLEHV